MSDRYRPPPKGPRSSRDYQRPDSSTYRSATYSQKQRDTYKPTGPRTYVERDRYRRDTYIPPAHNNNNNNNNNSHESSGQTQPNSASSNTSTTVSAERDVPSIGSKRSLPSGPSSYRKRREVQDDRYRSKSPSRPTIPKGPKRTGNQRENRGNERESDRPRHPPPTAPKRELKLIRSQIYSIKSKGSSIYQRVQQVGEGTYGKVYKAKHSLYDEFVAMKRLRLETEREGFPITAIREIKLLSSLDHENVVGLLEMMVENNQIYMIFDYMDHDLTGLLTHPDLKLEECHRKFLFKQLMEGLNYLHKKRVIHRDIKGSNILVDNIGRLKIADFGLARTMKIVSDGESPDYTNRVITIWYRPPELLLGTTDYGREVDIWGVGCLLIELYAKIAAFQGFDEVSQLCKIFNIMGTPTLQDWPEIEYLPWFEMLKPKVNVSSKFSDKYQTIMSEDGFNLAKRLLALNPKHRPTAEEALQDEYFVNDPQPEPLTFLKEIKGEWHEFETKQRRRQERKRLQEEEEAAKKAAKDSKITSSIREDADSVTTDRNSPSNVNTVETS
ncbi:CTD kinase subunit alpha [Spathaspora sp. JA1]|nr:CTD kinase subunit alpha [Spathaspora sp. JA1]